MLRPQLDQAMRGITQAPVSATAVSATNGVPSRVPRPTAAPAHQPRHRHARLNLPVLGRRHDQQPTVYRQVPPLEKLRAKLGTLATEPPVAALLEFVTTRSTASSAADVPLPLDLPAIIDHLRSSLQESSTALSLDALFPRIDLLRLAALDPRFRISVLSSKPPLPLALAEHVNALPAPQAAGLSSYGLRLTILQALANLAAAPGGAVRVHLLRNASTREALASLVATALLLEDEVERGAEGGKAGRSYAGVRAAAAALGTNILAADHARRLDGGDGDTQERGGDLDGAWRAEIAAALVEALRHVGSGEKAAEHLVKRRGLLLMLGMAAYGSDAEGEVPGVLEAVGAREVVAALHVDEADSLAKEILQVLEP